MGESRYGFGAPFIDVDEWRDTPRRHRYVHGGFDGTHTRFSFYFPPAEEFDGRFFQFLEGGAGGHESLLAAGGYPGQGNDWIFHLVFEEMGGYLVESNQGHFHNEGLGFANEVELFGASAESARYAKELAAEMYGSPPHHGYIWGGSGGGSRSIWCLENEPEVYDGASPHVIWSGTGATGAWSAWAFWWLHARDKRAEIIDATEPGGSGNPFEHLSNDQREALATLYRRGWPRRAESLLWSFGPWLFQMYNLKESDPDYYTDFWTKPGYLGHDDPERLAPVLVDEVYTVSRVVAMDDELGGSLAATTRGGRLAATVRVATAGAASGSDGGQTARGDRFAIVLEGDVGDAQQFCMSKVTVLSGEAAGRELYISQVGERNALVGFGEMAPDLFDDVSPGDEVRLENHDYIAFCYLHRYAIDVAGWSDLDPATGIRRLRPEFSGARADLVDGQPIYPQRTLGESSGGAHSGRFEGKMIHVNCALDSMVWPAHVVAYQSKVRAYQADKIDDVYRLWFVDNSPHGSPEFIGPFATPEKDPGVWRSRMVDYSGVTAEALRQLVAWVEMGSAPQRSTSFSLTDDSGLVLAATASQRGGVQPVVNLSAEGGVRAEVGLGETVHFEGSAEQPPGTGKLVVAEWDFEGTGAWADAVEFDGLGEQARLQAAHRYEQPGTYFASFRVGAHREGLKGRGPLMRNLARVRVVVSA